ncbi:MAG: nitroreductase family protein [Acetobacteraceae bacterium]|nr:nitroreductase family protein [Acetobacteraceae bacterium]
MDDEEPGRGKDPTPGAAILELMRSRRSIRLYQARPVPEAVLLELLEAARWAPSAANLQPWQFVVVTDPQTRAAVARWARLYFLRFPHVAAAPVLIAILGDPTLSRWYRIDCSLAGANLMLAAHALGLGTCWIGAFDERRVREVLRVPDRLEIVGLLTLGYPAEDPVPPPRFPLSDLVHREAYSPAVGPSLARRLTRSGIWSLRKRVRRFLPSVRGRLRAALRRRGRAGDGQGRRG